MGINAWILIGGLATLVLGAWLLRRGWWPKRTGDTPHCGKCDYVLTGNGSGVCPECGSEVTSSLVVLGDRYRRNGLGFFGAFMFLAALGLLSVASSGRLRSVDWYHYRPYSWLLQDMQSPTTSVSYRAWNEINRRLLAGALRDNNKAALTAVAVIHATTQPSTSADDEIDAFISKRATEGKLTQSQADLMTRSIIRSQVAVKSKVGSEEAIPFVHIAYPYPMDRQLTSLNAASKPEVWVDDQRMEGATFEDHLGYAPVPFPRLSPGHHRLRIFSEVFIQSPRDREIGGKSQGSSSWIEDSVDFEVISGHMITATNRPDPMDVHVGVSVCVYSGPNRSRLSCTVFNNTDHRNMAFEVFVRGSGFNEFRLGFAAIRRNGANGRTAATASTDTPPPVLPSKVDVILRSGRVIAERTFDMDEVWEGEIVIRNVQIDHESFSKVYGFSRPEPGFAGRFSEPLAPSTQKVASPPRTSPKP